MCYEWEEELRWYYEKEKKKEEEKVPVDIIGEPTKIQEPTAPEAA